MAMIRSTLAGSRAMVRDAGTPPRPVAVAAGLREELPFHQTIRMIKHGLANYPLEYTAYFWGSTVQAQLASDYALIAQLGANTVNIALYDLAGLFHSTQLGVPQSAVNVVAGILAVARDAGLRVSVEFLAVGAGYTNPVANYKALVDAFVTALPLGHTVKSVLLKNEPINGGAEPASWRSLIQAWLPYAQQKLHPIQVGLASSLGTIGAADNSAYVAVAGDVYTHAQCNTGDGLDHFRILVNTLGGLQPDFQAIHYYNSGVYNYAYGWMKTGRAIAGDVSSSAVFGAESSGLSGTRLA